MHFFYISGGKCALIVCELYLFTYGAVHAISEFITYEQTPQINAHGDVASVT